MRRSLFILAGGLALALPRAGAQPKGEKYAFLVGVRKYPKDELRDLRFAEADVTELAKVLIEAGYKPGNVVLLSQTVGAENDRFLPRADEIRRELRLLLKGLTPDDSVVVVLAGHGVQPRGKEGVLFCPAGARLGDPATLLPLADVYDDLGKCPAGFKLLLCDACRNDPQTADARSKTVMNLESVSRPQVVKPPGGLASFFSCSAGEQAFETDQFKHGVFFHYVIRGLRGDADLDRDGTVALPELEQYVKKHVYDFVRAEYGREQTPHLVGDVRGIVPLTGRVAPLSAKVAAVRPPPDEGFWPFETPPAKVKAKYGFDLTDAFLDRLRLATVRFNSGGTGAFVSADGLVLTNHHVAADVLRAASAAGRDYIRDGFLAATRAAELKCPDLELNVLQSIEDVTTRVMAAVTPAMSAEQATAARRAAIARIELESHDRTGLRSDVVTLYQGGAYRLYRYKSYSDIRIAFAPEGQIAFFGGDPDNFEYPRYDLDVCLLRAYENGVPARPPSFLPWSGAGAAEGELVFVAGHPGRTSRSMTVDEIEYLRDVQFPALLKRLKRLDELYRGYADRGTAYETQVRDDLYTVANSLKARRGGLDALNDSSLIASRRRDDVRLRAAHGDTGPWDAVASALARQKAAGRDYRLLESARPAGQLFDWARTLVRAAAERAKPNAERLREYGNARLASLEMQVLRATTLSTELETLKLGDWLALVATSLGDDSPLGASVLAGQSPQERAAKLVRGTRLADAEVRRQLWQGGAAAVAASSDPIIALARAVDADARRARSETDAAIAAKEQAYATIARAKFTTEGSNSYPDPTFTLRFSYGVVAGYVEESKPVPALTDFAGLYRRSAEHDGKPPFDLSPRWRERRDRIAGTGPLNFVSTNDIVGGNSGSPVVNQHGELVGVVFDGNMQSLAWDFTYTDARARAVSVHSAGIVEALRKVYDADKLADELTGSKK